MSSTWTIFSKMFMTRLRGERASRLDHRLSSALWGSSLLNLGKFLIYVLLLDTLKLFASFDLGLYLNILLLLSFQLWIIAATELGSLSSHCFADATNHPDNLLSNHLVCTPLPGCITVLSRWALDITRAISITGCMTLALGYVQNVCTTWRLLEASVCDPRSTWNAACLTR